MTIIQAFFANPESNTEAVSEFIGKGKLIKIPIFSVKRKFSRAIQSGSSISHLLLREVIFNRGTKRIIRKITRHPALARVSRLIAKHIALARNTVFREHYSDFTELFQNIIERYEIDLVIAHSRRLDLLSIFFAETKRRQIPLLVQNHGSNDRLRTEGVSAIVENVSGFGGVTDIGIPSEFRSKFTPLFNGIDLDFFDPDKADSGRPFEQNTSSFLILCPARISQMKGQIEFMDVVKRLVDRKLGIKLYLAGGHVNSGYMDELKKAISNLGLSSIVSFTGTLSQEQLRDWYVKSDVVVLPSKTEGLPRVLLEAQAMKKPVIAYDVGGVSQAFVDAKTGFLIDQGDRADFAEKLEILVLDKAKKYAMGESARKHAEKFGLQSLAARHERWYSEALDSNKLLLPLDAKKTLRISPVSLPVGTATRILDKNRKESK